MIDLKEYGYLWEETDPVLLPARVTAVHKERFGLVCREGETFARLKSSAYYGGSELFPTVGDFVHIQYNPSGDSLIVKTLPRRSVFERLDVWRQGHSEHQVVAANFDTVFILTSLNHDLNLSRIQRYLTLAWQSGAVPVVVLTKADLVPDPAPFLSEVQAETVGVDAVAVSAKTGEGLEKLSPYLGEGKTVVLLGSSGVGKSSLVNALAGEERMAVGGIREDDSRGRHTTTWRQMIRLPDKTLVIDTPGMRELGMWDVSEGLPKAFPEVEELAKNCRFDNCTHQGEPGCAVRAALLSGALSQDRWKDYQKLKKEARFTNAKEKRQQKRQEKAAGQAGPKKYNRKKWNKYGNDDLY